VHAVLYGASTNGNDLPDEAGPGADIDVEDDASEASIRLMANGTWTVNVDPTPLECTPLP
jgi:hypothetical protein